LDRILILPHVGKFEGLCTNFGTLGGKSPHRG